MNPTTAARGRIVARSIIGGRLVALLAILVLASTAWTEAPLTTVDVIRFLKAGISEHTVLYEVRGRGFTGPLGPTDEAALREAGASETLFVALRQAVAGGPAAGSGAQSPPTQSSTASPPSAPGALPPATPADATFAVKTRTVRVPVSVMDANGEPVLGLHGEDFRVAEDGRKQKVTLFSGERRPLRIALALDVSRSMDNKIRQVEEALRHFIDVLEPADEILVITFSDRVHVVQDFTSDRARLATVLDMLEPAGGTALYDAAFVAIQRVARGPAESKAVVLVTDGVDTSSTYSFKDLRELARRTEVPVFSIGLDAGKDLRNFVRGPEGGGPGGGRWPGGGGHGGFPGGGGRGGFPGGGGRGPGGGHGFSGRNPVGFDERPLVELAEDTGARAEILKGLEHYIPGSDEPPGSDRLKKAVETIATILRYRYLLGYEPPEGKGGWRTIRVDVDRPETTARARKGYYGGA